MKRKLARFAGMGVALSQGLCLPATADTQLASFTLSISGPVSPNPFYAVNWEPFQQDRGTLYEMIVCSDVTAALSGNAFVIPSGGSQTGNMFVSEHIAGRPDGGIQIADLTAVQPVTASGPATSPGTPQTLTAVAVGCSPPSPNMTLASSSATKYVQVTASAGFGASLPHAFFTPTQLSFTVKGIIKYNYIPDAPFPPSLDDPEPDWDDAPTDPDLRWKPTPHAASGYGAVVRPVFRPAALVEPLAYSNNSIPPGQNTLHVSSQTNETTGDGAMSPSGLEPCQWYSWQITAKNGSLSTPSAVQFFRVGIGGDLNHDRMTDDADFVIFLAAYNMLDCADPAMPAGCPADFNRDGVVDDGDFIRFLHGYDMLICP